MDIRERLAKARREMERQAIDCMVVPPSNDLLYLLGYKGFLMERPSLFFLLADKAYYLIPSFEMELLSENIRKHVKTIPWNDTENAFEKAAAILPQRPMRVAIGNTTPSVLYYRLQAAFPAWRWSLGEDVLGVLRAKKDEHEISCLIESHRRAERAFKRLLEHGLAGSSELAAAGLLRQYMNEEGLRAENLPIVAAGAGGSSPHHHTGETVICRGDAVVIDFGACYEGYYSDMTRTVAVGKAPAGFAEAYEVVKEANFAAFRSIRPGASCGEVDSAGRRVIEEAGFGEYFTHRLGHGIGLDCHEEPYIVGGNPRLLQVGNTFSDEPGIYLPNRFGIRTEDAVLVTEEGAERLDSLSHDLRVTE